MQLRSSPSSPFGRKVKMATYILGFDDQVTPVLTDTLDPNDSICKVNPLGKIPALEDDGTTYYDSRVIMEYLDAKAGGGIFALSTGAFLAGFVMDTKFVQLEGQAVKIK